MQSQKSTILTMRWLVVLLVIFMAGYSTKGIDFQSANYILAIIFVALNTLISLAPKRNFERPWFTYTLFVLDIVFVSAMIYLAEGIDTDFYLVYFLSIFMSSIGRTVGGALPVAFVASLLYGWLMYSKAGPEVLSLPSFWIRMPFFFLIALFSSFWASQAGRERQKKEEAERFSHRLTQEIESATDEIRRTGENYKVLKEYNENILASINSGVVVVDVDGTITTFNLQAAAILKLSQSSALGRKIKEVAGLDQIRELLNRTMDTGNTIQLNEFALQNGQGQEVTLVLSTSLLSNQTTRTNGAIAIFSDLTKTKSLEERVKHSEKLALLGEMAAVMAHEIRNPLNSIAGFAQLLQLKIQADHGHRKYVDIIVQEAFRVDTIISDILDFAHQKRIMSAKVDLAALLQRIVDLKRGNGLRKDVSLDLQLESKPLLLSGDAVRLERMFLNLISNAVEAMDSGGQVTIRARAAERPSGMGVAVDVSDTGCGIPPEQLASVFNPFFTTKPMGTGLGLAIIQKIAEEHKGDIKVESQLGEGTTFRIYLPQAA